MLELFCNYLADAGEIGHMTRTISLD